MSHIQEGYWYWSGEVEFVQLFPLQVLHAAEQSKIQHVHLFLRSTVADREIRMKYDVIPLGTKDFQDKIQEACKVMNDEWAETAWGRFEFVQDLHTADAVYNQACSVNFRTGKQIPKKHEND